MTLVILSLFVWKKVTLCSSGWPRTCSEEPGWTQLYRDHLCLFPKHWDEKCASPWLAASSDHPAAGFQLQPQLDLNLHSSRFMSAEITGTHCAWPFDILSIPIIAKSFSNWCFGRQAHLVSPHSHACFFSKTAFFPVCHGKGFSENKQRAGDLFWLHDWWVELGPLLNPCGSVFPLYLGVCDPPQVRISVNVAADPRAGGVTEGSIPLSIKYSF